MKKQKGQKRRPKPKKARRRPQSAPPVRAPATSLPGVPEAPGGGRGDPLALAAGALDAGRPADAMALLAEVLARRPDDADALNLAGVAAFRMGNAGDARDLLQTASAYRPDFAEALNNLGNVLKETGDLAEAEAAYGRALDARPGYLDALYNLGIALELQGRFIDAEAAYRRCLSADPGMNRARFNLANVLKALGRLDDARRAYLDAIAAEPGHAPALNNLGTVEMELGHTADAIHAYRRAVGADAAFAEAHYNLGIALQETGAPEDAIRCYEKALATDPGHAGAQMNVGVALAGLGRTDDAVAAYERAIAIAPAYDKAWTNLGDLYLAQGRAEDAVAVAERFLEGSPGNISGLAFKAIALNEADRPADARALNDFDRLLRAAPIAAPEGFADVDAFNAALAEHVLGHPSLAYAPASHATRFGRHSGELLVAPLGPMTAFEAAVGDAVEAYRSAVPPDPDHPYLARRPAKVGLSVWGVAMNSHGHQVAHIHPSAWLSGVYYVRLPDAIAAGDAAHAGWIEFGRPPEDFHAERAPEVRLVRPEEGLMILFPSYLYHRTVPFESDQVRISIAFDVLALDGADDGSAA